MFLQMIICNLSVCICELFGITTVLRFYHNSTYLERPRMQFSVCKFPVHQIPEQFNG